jgi:hypothetical protein
MLQEVSGLLGNNPVCKLIEANNKAIIIDNFLGINGWISKRFKGVRE